jgi:hypothetical protein
LNQGGLAQGPEGTFKSVPKGDGGWKWELTGPGAR